MFTPERREQIIALIKREVVPAIGCTEPVAVALCVAHACEVAGCNGEHLPEKIEVRLSANILKNAMGVGIPGTGMIGLPIAIALGAIVGRSEYGLEVLRDANAEAVERGKQYIDEKRISIELAEGDVDKLYIEVHVTSPEGNSTAIISGGHTSLVYKELNGEVLLDKRNAHNAEEEDDDESLTLRDVYEFATTTPLEEIEFILESKHLNKAAAESAFSAEYGHSLGRTLRGERERNIVGDTIFSRILSYTAAACDARMGGAMVPVMSNSGSGNQGITATLPVVVYGEECGASQEQMIRSLTLSHLTVIYIKQSLGRLSALCGCVVAAAGSSCGITYLMGGGYDEVAMAIKNMIANLTGMICDGAKPSCALKLASGVSTAVLSAMLAMEHRCVSKLEGIIDEDVDKSIRNLTTIGRDGMNLTDEYILSIMTNKC
ncbi:MAG: serine dehydratase subunit alpha family protein [Alistipes sp.]|nr:serine dehydratase subunit alpha family protein [Alistipes sp.]